MMSNFVQEGVVCFQGPISNLFIDICWTKDAVLTPGIAFTLYTI